MTKPRHQCQDYTKASAIASERSKVATETKLGSIAPFVPFIAILAVLYFAALMDFLGY